MIESLDYYDKLIEQLHEDYSRGFISKSDYNRQYSDLLCDRDDAEQQWEDFMTSEQWDD